MQALIKKFENASKLVLDAVASSWFLKLTFAWFILQAIFFAATTRYGLPPDEVYHFTYIKLFAENFPSPFLTNQGGYDVLLEATRNPFFLYHYLLSFPYLLVSSLDNSFIFLRFINILFGIGSLYLVYKIAVLSKLPALITNISIFMLCSTLMFVFLSGSISYDNLFVLLSLCGIFVMLKLLKKVSAKNILALTAIIVAGSLVKINFLPMAFVLVAIFAYKYHKKIPIVIFDFKKSFNKARIINIFICILICMLGILFTEKYVLNLIHYKKLAPNCEQVRSLEDCRRNALFRREEMLVASNQKGEIGLPQYTINWFSTMLDRTFGIFAHERFLPNKFIDIYSRILIVLSTVLIIRYWTFKDKILSIFTIIILFNTLSLLIFENYAKYKDTGILGLAVHGRYLFAILPLIYILANYYIFKNISSNIVKAIIICATILIFATSSLPTYLYKATKDWYISSQS